MTEIETPNTVVISVAFCFFWMVTLENALNSVPFYFLRTFVVAGYMMVMTRYQGNSDTFVESLGWFLAVCHWLGMFQVLLYGDPRFTGRND